MISFRTSITLHPTAVHPSPNLDSGPQQPVAAAEVRHRKELSGHVVKSSHPSRVPIRKDTERCSFIIGRENSLERLCCEAAFARHFKERLQEKNGCAAVAVYSETFELWLAAVILFS